MCWSAYAPCVQRQQKAPLVMLPVCQAARFACACAHAVEAAAAASTRWSLLRICTGLQWQLLAAPQPLRWVDLTRWMATHAE